MAPLTDNSHNADLTGIGQGPGPHIPGDDLTDAELQHMGKLVDKLLPPVNTVKMYTPPPITGYRKLSQLEVDLMNEIKALGQGFEEMVKKVQAQLLVQRREAARLPVQEFDAELQRIDRAEPARWAAIGRTHFQEGLMALTRAVAQPSSF